jgi:hypothetical protein
VIAVRIRISVLSLLAQIATLLDSSAIRPDALAITKFVDSPSEQQGSMSDGNY